MDEQKDWRAKMNTLLYILPLVLVIISNIIYHLISKSTSTTVNPFAALAVTYGTAFLGSIMLFLLTKKTTIYEEMINLKMTNYLMGFVIIGVEGGYMLMYKKGWEVSKCSLVTNICVAIILLFIGIFLFHEKINSRQIIGLIICLIGIILINIR